MHVITDGDLEKISFSASNPNANDRLIPFIVKNARISENL